MECKCEAAEGLNILAQELIETLWNVNMSEQAILKAIDKGINRNIVECKFVNVKDFSCIRIELIETLWNVNVCSGMSSRLAYLWN